MENREITLDASSFRRTLGLFATGVSVLAVQNPDGSVIGMTANSITSVSLDPLLLLVCIERRANIAPYVLEAPGFSLSFLNDRQAALSDYFAGRWQGEPPPFEFQPWKGGPLLAGCIASLGCQRDDAREGGDHWIVLGQVVALYRQEHAPDPLMFFSSQYHRLSPHED